MATERFWSTREPGQRTWVDRRQLWEAPVQDGGQVARTAEVATGGRRFGINSCSTLTVDVTLPRSIYGFMQAVWAAYG
jgi:hypothetical protein